MKSEVHVKIKNINAIIHKRTDNQLLDGHLSFIYITSQNTIAFILQDFYNAVNTAKNLLLIVELEPIEEENMTAEYWEPIGKVSRTVFEELNDAKEIIYTGTGTNWSSNTTVKYYEYFYKDQEATLRHESWNQTTSTLQYLGDDIASVGDISYEYQLGSHGGSGSGLSIQPDGTVGLGSSGGSGSIPRKDDTITFTITWNDQTETFTGHALN